MEELASQFWPTAGPLIVLLVGVVIYGVWWVYQEDRARIKRLEEEKASKDHVNGVHTDLKDSLDDMRKSVRRIEGLLMEGRRG